MYLIRSVLSIASSVITTKESWSMIACANTVVMRKLERLPLFQGIAFGLNASVKYKSPCAGKSRLSVSESR